jgi:hypothetical protein
MTEDSLTKPGVLSWYIVPTSQQFHKIYNKIKGHPALQRYIAHAGMRPYYNIVFTNGSEINFKSFDQPDNLRGDGVDFCYVDEIQNIGADQFWDVVRPLISGTRGQLVVSGQFRGENWYHKEFFLKGQSKRYQRHMSWRHPTSTGMRFQSAEGKAELEDAKSQMVAARYNQEYECIPTANQQAVFRQEDLKAAKRGRSYKRAKTGSNIIGLDLGRVRDQAGIAVLNIEKSAFLHSELRPHKEYHSTTAKHCKDLGRDFNNASYIVDVTGGATGGKKPDQDAYVKIYEKELQRMFKFYWTPNNKQEIIETFALGLEQKLMTIPADQVDMHRQLQLYEFSYNRNKYDYHGPGGHDDDLVAAAAMAWYGKQKNMGPSQRAGTPLTTIGL